MTFLPEEFREILSAEKPVISVIKAEKLVAECESVLVDALMTLNKQERQYTEHDRLLPIEQLYDGSLPRSGGPLDVLQRLRLEHKGAQHDLAKAKQILRRMQELHRHCSP